MGRKNRKNNPPKNIKFSTPTKEAKHIKDPEGYQFQYIAWHFQCMDKDGKWSCNIDTIRKIENRLHEYERLRWFEVVKPRSNHPLPINKVISKAQTRLFDFCYQPI